MFLLQTVSPDVSASFVWELVNSTADYPTLPCLFTVQYRTENDSDTVSRCLKMHFDLVDYMVSTKEIDQNLQDITYSRICFCIFPDVILYRMSILLF